MGTVDNTQLQALVNDLETKEQALSDASDANDAAQAAAQAAIATATGTASARQAAHDTLATSIQALVDYVNGLAAAP